MGRTSSRARHESIIQRSVYPDDSAATTITTTTGDDDNVCKRADLQYKVYCGEREEEAAKRRQ